MIQTASGTDYTLALKSDGTVWAWGVNGEGQLGDGTNTDRLLPIQVPGLTGIVQVVSGGRSSLALASDGTVWSWGSNSNGLLGAGKENDGFSSTPLHLKGLTNVIQIVAGTYHSLVVKSDGTVWGRPLAWIIKKPMV